MAIYTGQTYDPQESRTAELPRIKTDVRMHPFRFVHSPGSWELVDLEAMGVPEDDRDGRFEWVPVLKVVDEFPGVNGMSDNPRSVGRVLGEMRERGWVVIDHSHAPDGVNYCQRLRTAYGDRYADVFTSFVRVGVGTWTPRADKLAFLQWRRKLVREGVIEAPPQEVIDLRGKRTSAVINRLAKSAHLPHIAAQIEYLQERQAGMREATTAATKPTRKRARSKA